MLYVLWDLGLKVGHSSRSLDEMVRQAMGDLTIRTALLEARYVWGDRALSRGCASASGRDHRRQRQRLHQREARRARRAPQADGRQPLCRRAQRQGGQGRPARSPHAVLDRQISVSASRRVAELVDKRLLTRERAAPLPARRELPVGGALPSPLPDRPAEDRLTFDLQREIAGACATPTCRPHVASSASCSIIS